MGAAKQTLPIAIRKWHEIAKTGDRLALDALLAPDVVFESPVVHMPQRGKAIAATYLSAAIVILGGADFRYVAEWVGSKSAVLEFVTIIDGIEINGVDIIGWNAGPTDRSLQSHGAAAESHPDSASEDGGGAVELTGRGQIGRLSFGPCRRGARPAKSAIITPSNAPCGRERLAQRQGERSGCGMANTRRSRDAPFRRRRSRQGRRRVRRICRA